MPRGPMDRGPRGSAGPETVWTEMGQVAGHGLTLAASTGFFLAVGWWLDGRMGVTPLLTILGALLGAGAGLYSIYHHMVVAPRERDRRKQDAERALGEDVPPRGSHRS